MTRDEINAVLDQRGIRNVELAEVVGISEDKVSKARSHSGTRKWTAEETSKILAYLNRGFDISREPDLPLQAREQEYLPVEVLPTYAGAGGGGTGDADRVTALVPRMLIVDILRGRASDFLLINLRGDSMEPDFRHEDQLLIDRRDRSPTQPGPFALWIDDEYVVKNVERLPGGEVRIFSSNAKYTAVHLATDDTKIIGRPVWCGRRL